MGFSSLNPKVATQRGRAMRNLRLREKSLVEDHTAVRPYTSQETQIF